LAFHQLGLTPPLTDTLRRLGFERPTPIQEKAIPPVLAGRDVVGSAETGSGKTAAFLLPSLQRLLTTPKPGGTRVLVLVPTRELATQVHTVATELAAGTGIGCVPVYGGVPIEGQAPGLRSGVDIVVATPGRLLDLAGRGSTRFRELEVLVLDEADRMLDMGFLPDIRRILWMLPKTRQTLLFSATMPPEIVELAGEIMREPERIRVGHPRTTSAPVGITHAIYPVPSHRKTALLTVLLRRGGMSSVLVFTRTKAGAEKLARELSRAGIGIGVMHGDRSQTERERDLASFMDGYVKVLVATDVAARGLDVEGITHVINYDFPRSPEDYLHRVGRTARARAKGDAFALVSPEEEGDIAAVEREMGASIPRVTLPEFDYSGRGAPPSGGGGSSGGRGGRGGDARRGGGGGGHGGESRGGRGGRPSAPRGGGARPEPRPAPSATPAHDHFGPPPDGASPPPPPAPSGGAAPPREGGSRGRRRGRGRR
jgi:ATP-dependent RNA helicase RhlE